MRFCFLFQTWKRLRSIIYVMDEARLPSNSRKESKSMEWNQKIARLPNNFKIIRYDSHLKHSVSRISCSSQAIAINQVRRGIIRTEETSPDRFVERVKLAPIKLFHRLIPLLLLLLPPFYNDPGVII